MPYGNNNGGYNRYPSGGQRQSSYPPRNSGPRGQQGQGQTQQSKNLSGSGPTLFNEPAGRFLNFNYWGRYASIEIGVCPIGSQLSWDTRKAAQKVTQVISFGDLSELEDICEEVIDSIKNTGTFTPAGTRVGSRGDCIVEINNGSTIGMSPGVYLVIYKNLDSANRTNNLEFYPFTNCKVLRGYDHTSGNAKEDISKVGEFKKFYKMVKEATKAFTMAQAHAVNVGSEYDRLRSFKLLSALTASLGIDVGRDISQAHAAGPNGGGKFSGPRNNGGYNGPRNAPRSSTFESSNYPTTNPQVLASIDDPVDINLSMESLTNVDMSKFT